MIHVHVSKSLNTKKDSTRDTARQTYGERFKIQNELNLPATSTSFCFQSAKGSIAPAAIENLTKAALASGMAA